MIELSRPQTVADQARLIAAQDVELQYFLWERFVYLERALEDLASESQVFPADFGIFLKQGLLELWHLREQKGLFD